ncbi:MAG: hypothetical protein COW89_03835 [Nitrospinae bacterium CG22_combo_CG10-13_8_21_14_all_47_10]|nr:MAG: hypothetical protein COW89_03835 [Nitrospinae bacterium CG22_combo_CG10-13_8_21_14_all_47_10]
MKKAIVFVAVSAFVGFLAMGSIVAADDVVPGQYSQQDQSVMGVGQTMLQMGAQARTLTNAVNLASGAGRSRNSNIGVHQDYQFGSSQSEQSWKKAKSVEDAGVVVGLVPGDCRGDNSSDAYRKQMNQSRDGYMEEKLVSQSDCAEIHPTIK